MRLLLAGRVKVLLERDAQLLPQRLQLLQVLLVLALVLNLGLDACGGGGCAKEWLATRLCLSPSPSPSSFVYELTLEDADSCGEVVHSPGGLQGRDQDRRRGDEVVGKDVVQVAL